MGAVIFYDYSEGGSVEEAFDAAVKHARYNYGHAGYTGTIAEKDSYVLVTNKTLSPFEAQQLADRLIERDDPRISDKWGPAGAIRMDNGEWLFFGWASS